MTERSAKPGSAVQEDADLKSACGYRHIASASEDPMFVSMVGQAPTITTISQVQGSPPGEDGAWQCSASDAIRMASGQSIAHSQHEIIAGADQNAVAQDVATSSGGSFPIASEMETANVVHHEVAFRQGNIPTGKQDVECSDLSCEATSTSSAMGHNEVNSVPVSVQESLEPESGVVRTSVIQVLEGWREADANLAEIEAETGARGAADDTAGFAVSMGERANAGKHGATDDTSPGGLEEKMFVPGATEALEAPEAPEAPGAPERPDVPDVLESLVSRASSFVEGAVSAAAFGAWLSDVDPSGALAVYHQILLDSYDTVDQITRLYVLPEAPGALSAEFFTDIGAMDPVHQQLFLDWFASQAPLDPAPAQLLLEPAREYDREPMGNSLGKPPGPTQSCTEFVGDASDKPLGTPPELDRYSPAMSEKAARHHELRPAAAGDRSATPSASCWGPLSFLWGGRRPERGARARSEPALRTPLRSGKRPNTAMPDGAMPPVSSLTEATDDLLGPLELSSYAFGVKLDGSVANGSKQQDVTWRWSQNNGGQS